MQTHLRILLLEDEPTDAELMEHALREAGLSFTAERVDTREAFVQALEAFKPDIVLSDYKLPAFDGGSAVKLVRQYYPTVPVVVVTGVMGDEKAVELLKLGARDYVLKDRLARLGPAVLRALDEEQGIRARKASEKALRESEADLRALVEHSPVAMIVDAGTGEDEKIVMMNRQFTGLFGYTMEDLPDMRHWWPLAYPDESYRNRLLADWSGRVEKVLQDGGEVEPMEVTVACKDGSSRYVRISLSPSGGKNILTFEDLTGRKQMEDALRETSDRNRVIMETASDAIICIKPDGIIYMWNHKAEEMFGYTAGEAAGHELHHLIVPERYREKALEGLRQFAETGTGYVVGKTVELTAWHKNRVEFPIELSISPMNIHGEWHATGIIRDISERKQADQALRESEEIFNRFMEFSPIYVFFKDENIRALRLSKNYEKLLGKPMAEMLGKNMDELFPSEFAKRMVADDMKVLKEGKATTVEEEFSGRYYATTKFPIFIGGQPRFLAGYTMDITERKHFAAQQAMEYRHIAEINTQLTEANQQLKQAQSQLLQSEKMAAIGHLAAGVAHEINNPIGYVNSNLGTLEKYLADIFTIMSKYEATEMLLGMLLDANDPFLDELNVLKQKIDLDYIREDIRALIAESRQGLERVKNIVLDLKNFSRADTEEQWMLADLHQGMDATLNVVRNELKYKCEIVKEYGTLPKIYCLPAQLDQVFMNLLMNAAQAIEERGRITLRTGQEGDRVWIEVSDTGVGIPPENMPRLFDPFFTTKPVGEGTGLGLAVSYRIVEKHHGKIEVHSEVGKGTTFKIWLPVQQPGTEGMTQH